MGSETLPSTLYVLYDESSLPFYSDQPSIPFYFTSNGILALRRNLRNLRGVL